jgi:para-nitrobenzyl esterase
MVRKQSAAGLPAYLYLFDHCYPAAGARDLCNFHAGELPYVFGRIGAQAALPPNWPRPEGDAERRMSRAMIAYWTSFARTGRPVAPGQPAWRPYADRRSYMHFAATPEAAHDLLPGMFALQEDVVKRRRAANRQWFVNVGVAAPMPADTMRAVRSTRGG